MRKNLKPSLRQDSLRRVRRTIDPVEEIIFDVGQDTTINFEGSPLMQPGLVNDPNGKVVVDTDSDDGVLNNSYKDREWIAIGLATDNVTGATDEIVDNPGPNQGDPEEGSGGDYQPPTSVAGGDPLFMEYTQIGPKRSVLLFDLTSIPSNAVVTEATLNITNTNPPTTEGDIFNDGSGDAAQNTWPAIVTCEVLSLPQDTTADCTWNTKDRSVITVDGINVVDPTKRWWRTSESGVVPPNAIGIAQNTRREDHPEPQEFFDGQAIIGNPSNASGVGGEYYGHIGYGISGGGYAVNLDPDNPSVGHPTFDVTVESLTIPNNVFSVDVSNNVQYSITNQNRRCNLLLRARHWNPNTAAENPEEQRRYPENSNPDVLEFDSAYLSDSAGGPELDPPEIENDETLHVVPVGLVNETSVSYQWQIEVPVVYEPITNVQGTINNSSPQEQDTMEVTSVAYDGGAGDDTDTISYQWFREGAAESGETSSTYVVPEPSAGDEISCQITVSNAVEGDAGSSTTLGPYTVRPDGNFTLNVVRDPNDPAVPEGGVAVVNCTVTGVNRPFFRYHWTADRSGVDYPDFEKEVITENTTSTSNSIPLYVPGGGLPSPVARCSITLYEGDPNGAGVELTSETVEWNVADVPAVGDPNEVKLEYSGPLPSPFACPGAPQNAAIDTFTSINTTLGTDLVDVGITGIRFDDLPECSFANGSGGGISTLRLGFGGPGIPNTAKTNWLSQYWGITVTLKNQNGQPIETYSFSGQDPGDGAFDTTSNNDAIFWRTSSFDPTGDNSTTIPTYDELLVLQQTLIRSDVSTLDVDLFSNAFGETIDFVEINFIPRSGGGGDDTDPEVQPKPGADTIPTIGDFGENADGVISFTSTSTVTDVPNTNYNEGYPESDLDILTVGNVTLADKNTTTDLAFSRFFNQYVCPRVEPVSNVIDPADGTTVVINAGNTREYYDFYYDGDDSKDYDPGSGEPFSGPNFALVTYQWDEVNGAWNLVGYRTGKKINIPEFSGNLPDHMYFAAGNQDATDYLDESMGHVLYVFNTREDYELNVPADWQDINSWNTEGVSFPVIPV